jgi:anti-anti-sigma factor
MSSQAYVPWLAGDAAPLLGTSDTEALRRELLTLAEKAASPLLRLDFGSVEYLTAAGLGILIAVHTRLRDTGGRLILCNVHPKVEEILRVTRLDKVLDLTPPREQAA